jgi:hypothetical protein
VTITDPEHTCHAKKCKAVVPPSMLMCRGHWRMVPKGLQQKVWDEYVPGQEITKTPTMSYLHAARAAIDYVAEKEKSKRRA